MFLCTVINGPSSSADMPDMSSLNSNALSVLMRQASLVHREQALPSSTESLVGGQIDEQVGNAVDELQVAHEVAVATALCVRLQLDKLESDTREKTSADVHKHDHLDGTGDALLGIGFVSFSYSLVFYLQLQLHATMFINPKTMQDTIIICNALQYDTDRNFQKL